MLVSSASPYISAESQVGGGGGGGGEGGGGGAAGRMQRGGEVMWCLFPSAHPTDS